MKNFAGPTVQETLWALFGVSMLSLTMMGINSSFAKAESDLSGLPQVFDEGFGHDDGRVKSPLGFRSDPGPPTDGQIEGAIKRRLEMDSRISTGKMGVSVKDHTAKLFGTADTIKEKKLATVVAGSVMGVSAVQNDLRVRSSLSRDEKIKRNVEQVIHPIEFKKGNRLRVKVEEGIVTLEGEVLERQDMRRAGSAVEEVPGVTRIVNLIRVVSQNRSDSAIEKDVISYLISSPLVNEDNLEVDVEDGVVTLEGTIDHLIFRNVLQIDIENIWGVKHVRVGKLVPGRFMASAQQE